MPKKNGMTRFTVWIPDEDLNSVYSLVRPRREAVADFVRRAIRAQLVKEVPESKPTHLYAPQA